MTDNAEKIAALFACMLKASPYLEGKKWAEMQRRNALPEYADDICASHDFCDANVIMERAFESAVDRSFDMQSESDCSLWSDAWSIAKREYLTA